MKNVNVAPWLTICVCVCVCYSCICMCVCVSVCRQNNNKAFFTPWQPWGGHQNAFNVKAKRTQSVREGERDTIKESAQESKRVGERNAKKLRMQTALSLFWLTPLSPLPLNLPSLSHTHTLFHLFCCAAINRSRLQQSPFAAPQPGADCHDPWPFLWIMNSGNNNAALLAVNGHTHTHTRIPMQSPHAAAASGEFAHAPHCKFHW